MDYETVLGATQTRNLFLDDLMELREFLAQRQQELTMETTNILLAGQVGVASSAGSSKDKIAHSQVLKIVLYTINGQKLKLPWRSQAVLKGHGCQCGGVLTSLIIDHMECSISVSFVDRGVCISVPPLQFGSSSDGLEVQSSESVGEMLGHVTSVLDLLTNSRIQHLFLIKGSPR